MTTLDVRDLFDAPAVPRRVPSDDFETRLFREHILHAVEQWSQTTYRAHVSHRPLEPGAWKLTISEHHTDQASDAMLVVGAVNPSWPRVETGTIWIEDRVSRPVVAWRLGEQSGTGDYAPVNPWGTP